MPFPLIPHPGAKPLGFYTRVTLEEVLSHSDLNSLIRTRLQEAHESMKLPELPPGWHYEVTVEKSEDLLRNEFKFYITYTPRRDNGDEEALGQGDLEVRGDFPRLAGRVPDSRGLEGYREAPQDPAGDGSARGVNTSSDADTHDSAT